jgi:hypothetical protein
MGYPLSVLPGLAWDLQKASLGIRTLRYAQETIRHKRITSHAARGPLPFIPFVSCAPLRVLKKVAVTFPLEKCFST